MEIRVLLLFPGRPLPHSHLVHLPVCGLHQTDAVPEVESSEVPAASDVPGETLEVELESVAGDPGRGAGAGELLDHLLAGLDGSEPGTCQH